MRAIMKRGGNRVKPYDTNSRQYRRPRAPQNEMGWHAEALRQLGAPLINEYGASSSAGQNRCETPNLGFDEQPRC